ncbi:hypothetical protein EDC94DRAFT_647598 [Helicostylum pulchrum]|nr:hypothetical protein EDC94DRAFT_647598 [Helicostylum pulchrum]
MALHFITLIFTICSFVLLLIANLGTTFDSTFLPSIHLVQVNQAVTGRYIRYGVYSSCLYYTDSKKPHSCTKTAPSYAFDSIQFADACGADLTNTTTVKVFTDVVSDSKLTTFKAIVLIMPAVILSFIALACALFIRRARSSNVIPFIGTFASLFAFFTGGAGLAIVIVTFWKGFSTLEKRVEGLSHTWGPSIYLVGVGAGCAIVVFVCFVVSLFSDSDKDKRETFHLYDYDLNRTDGGDNVTTPKVYEATAHLNTPAKHDSYNDYYHAVSTPTTQNYPSFNQKYQQQQYGQPQTYQEPAYQQQQNGTYY